MLSKTLTRNLFRLHNTCHGVRSLFFFLVTSYILLASATGPASAAPSYSVGFTVDKAQAARGEQVTYSLTVTNNGDVNLTNTFVYLGTRPANATYVNGSSVRVRDGNSVSIVDAWYNDPQGTNLGTLTPNQAFTFKWKVSINSDALQGSTQNLTLGVKTSELSDPRGFAQSFMVSVDAARSSLCATKGVDKQTANVGDTLTFTIRVCNDGDIDQTNVLVYDKLPRELTYKAGTTTLQARGATISISDAWVGQAAGADGMGINLGTLNSGETFTITYQATLNGNATNNQTIENTAQTKSDQLPNWKQCAVTFKAIVPPVVCTGVIGDFVWNDVNANGIQEAGEPGIAGVTLTLKNSSGVVIATTTTDSNGAYRFNNLCAATYTVSASTPAGSTATTANAAGSTTANDSNPNPATVVLAANNSSDLTIDFGFKQIVTAGGRIVVKKIVDPGSDPTKFTFSGNLSGQIGHNETLAADVAAGSYTVTEAVSSGFELTSVSCDDSNSVPDLGNKKATYNVSAGETVTCTFSNRKLTVTTGSPNCSLTKKIRLPNGNEVTSVDGATHVYVPGESVIYRLFLSNPGSADGTSYKIIDTLPTYVFWQSGDGSYDSGGNKVTFDLGTLKGGQSSTLTYTAKVRDQIPAGSVTQTNSANVTYNGGACSSASSLVIGKPGQVLAASVLPQTGAFSPAIVGTFFTIAGGLAVRLRKIKKYKYWNQ